MRRTLLILAMAVVGIMLGVGLSLSVDAIAGSDLSDPVPLGVTSQAATHQTPETPHPERSSATTAKDDHGDDHGGSSPSAHDGSGRPGSSGSDDSVSGSGGSDDIASGSDGSSDGGSDDALGGDSESGSEGGDD